MDVPKTRALTMNRMTRLVMLSVITSLVVRASIDGVLAAAESWAIEADDEANSAISVEMKIHLDMMIFPNQTIT